MYARLIMFTLGAGKRQFAEGLAKQFQSVMQGMKGFKNATFLADEGVGEYGLLSVWATKEDAESAADAMRPGFQQALEGKVQGPPSVRMLEVFEP